MFISAIVCGSSHSSLSHYSFYAAGSPFPHCDKLLPRPAVRDLICNPVRSARLWIKTFPQSSEASSFSKTLINSFISKVILSQQYFTDAWCTPSIQGAQRLHYLCNYIMGHTRSSSMGHKKYTISRSGPLKGIYTHHELHCHT